MTQPPTIHLRADTLKIARAAAKIHSDYALAKAMGVDRATVSRTLRGEAGITAAFITKLLNAFPGVEFDELFTVDRPPLEEIDEEEIESESTVVSA